MRCHGIEQPSDIPLSLAAIEVLALEATSRDLGIAELMGQSLVASSFSILRPSETPAPDGGVAAPNPAVPSPFKSDIGLVLGAG